jgi:translation initiation factor IF-3
MAASLNMKLSEMVSFERGLSENLCQSLPPVFSGILRRWSLWPTGEDAISKDLRINQRIRAKEIRLISQDGEQLGIVALDQALAMGEEAGLDVVEVAPNARPPVCKLMDYGKYKYLQKQKAKEAKKNQSQIQLKEVKLRPKTDTHDRDVKKRHIIRFLQEGNKAKVTLIFRGREIHHKELGARILRELAEDIADVAVVEKMPSMEGRSMIMILAPKGDAPSSS